MLTKQRATLNITDRDMLSEQYNLIDSIYKNSDGWIGYNDSFICWFNDDETKKHISFSAEMHGLIFEAFMEEDEWKKWLSDFIARATEVFGFKVLDYE